MIRAFSQHTKRVSQVLDGHWDFIVDPSNLGMKEKWFHRFPEKCRRLYVPAAGTMKSLCTNTKVQHGTVRRLRFNRKGMFGSCSIT